MINCIEVCILPSRTPPLQALVLLEVQMGSDSAVLQSATLVKRRRSPGLALANPTLWSLLRSILPPLPGAEGGGCAPRALRT